MPDELDKLLFQFEHQRKLGTFRSEIAKQKLNAHYLAEILEVIGELEGEHIHTASHENIVDKTAAGRNQLRVELISAFQAKYGGK